MSVYRIRCNQTANTYIGSTRDIETRIEQHEKAADDYKCGLGREQNSFHAVRRQDFTVDILYTTCREDLLQLETKAILESFIAKERLLNHNLPAKKYKPNHETNWAVFQRDSTGVSYYMAGALIRNPVGRFRRQIIGAILNVFGTTFEAVNYAMFPFAHEHFIARVFGIPPRADYMLTPSQGLKFLNQLMYREFTRRYKKTRAGNYVLC